MTSPWPLGSYAPGNYFAKCTSCGVDFEGDKRALSCLDCAVASIKNAYRALAGEAVALKADVAVLRTTLSQIAGGKTAGQYVGLVEARRISKFALEVTGS